MNCINQEKITDNEDNIERKKRGNKSKEISSKFKIDHLQSPKFKTLDFISESNLLNCNQNIVISSVLQKCLNKKCNHLEIYNNINKVSNILLSKINSSMNKVSNNSIDLYSLGALNNVSLFNTLRGKAKEIKEIIRENDNISQRISPKKKF